MTRAGKAGSDDGASAAPDIASVINQFRVGAAEAGIPEHIFDSLTRDLEFSSRVLELASAQPEHERAIGDYITTLLSDERVATGQQKRAQHDRLLSDIRAQFGVPDEIIIAIWGIESSYGAGTGTYPVIPSLLTLAAMPGRRQEFWRAQLFAAMTIVAAGDAPADKLVGSWAGAMGHTQFIPTTFLDHAVDFDGDGRRDVWNSPADALASTANYLRNSGWQPGLSWGYEVELETTFDYATLADDAWRPRSVWHQAGVGRLSAAAGSAPLNADLRLQLKLPAGASGPAFLVSENFQAILAYNAAIAYALAVGQLADRIAGAPPLSAVWPDVVPLTRQERIELQQLLVARGYDTGGVDGILGRASRKAIRAFQLRRGAASGWISQP